MEGCYCPTGYYYNQDGECVEKEDCGCKYQGKFYKNGETRKSQCNTWYIFFSVISIIAQNLPNENRHLKTQKGIVESNESYVKRRIKNFLVLDQAKQ